MSEIVIARYNEDLDWIGAIPARFRVTVYNKGEQVTSAAALDRADRIIDRPNQGRESETFLHHMTTCEGVPDDVTVFTQGDPFEHSPDFLALLDRADHWHPLQALSWRWKTHLPPADVHAVEQNDYIDGLRVRRELFSLANWGPLHFMDDGALRTGLHYWAKFGQPVGRNIAAHFFGLCRLHELAERADTHLLGRFSYGAVFATRNDRMQALPRQSLLMMRHLSTGPAMFGYVIERLWLHLLGEPFVMPMAQDEHDPTHADALATEAAIAGA